MSLTIWLRRGNAPRSFSVRLGASATVNDLCQLISQEERWDLLSVRVSSPACAALNSLTPLTTVPTSPEQPLTYWCATPPARGSDLAERGRVPYDTGVRRIVEMGFTEQQVHDALEQSGFVIDTAVDLLVGAADPAQSVVIISAPQLETLLRGVETATAVRQQLRRFGFVTVTYESSDAERGSGVLHAEQLDKYARTARGKTLQQIVAEADARTHDPRPRREIVLERMWERVAITLTQAEKEFLDGVSGVVPFAVAMQALILGDRDITRCIDLLEQAHTA
jgi:hypothetical protein